VLDRFAYKWVVATVFVMALFIDILDVTIVNVSLVKIAAELDAGAGATTWIVLGYSLSLAVWIPISGWLGDRFGTKKIFVFALMMFVIASTLCATAQTLNQLIGFRVLQGVGGGMLTPTGVTLLFRAFPPEERAKASGILTIPTVLAPASGPLIGGLLTDTVGWRWIFAVNLPIGLLALVIAIVGLKDDVSGDRRPFDVPGFTLAAVGFPAAVFFLERGSEEGWLSPQIVVSGVLGVLALGGLWRWSSRTPTPMLDVKLLNDRLFRTTNIVSFASTMAFLGIVFILPQFLQRVAGHSALASGTATFPQALGVIAVSRYAAKLYPKIGPRRLLMFAYFGLAASSVPFLFIQADTNLWLIRITMFVRGLFLAFSFVPLQAASYARISPADTGRASAIFSTQRQLGAATGVALLSTVLLSTIPSEFGRGVVPAAQVGGFTTAFRWSFLAAIALTLLAGLLATRVSDQDAAASMRTTSRAK
jgi:EmrB/QacA subfamily drug resistance transporter